MKEKEEKESVILCKRVVREDGFYDINTGQTKALVVYGIITKIEEGKIFFKTAKKEYVFEQKDIVEGKIKIFDTNMPFKQTG